MTEPVQPMRAVYVGIRIGADDDAALLRCLRQIVVDLELKRGLAFASGGYDAGYESRMIKDHDPDMTHDKYFEMLDAWLDSKVRQQ